jgi:hypothetical protein
MGGWPDGDSFHHLIPRTTKKLGLKQGECGFHPIGAASLRICDYYSSKEEKLGKTTRLRVYQLTWYTLTQWIKMAYLGDDSDGEYSDQRLEVHGDIKRVLVNENLSDAVLYVGKFKTKMQAAVEGAICLMLADLGPKSEHVQFDNICKDANKAAEQDEIAVITYSLGSRMVFDTLNKMGEDSKTRDDAERFTQKVTKFFMLADQLPLLELGEVEFQEKMGTQDKARGMPTSLKGFIAARRQRMNDPLKIVAFSDPNDLLSYPIPKYFDTPDDPSVDFINVVLSIAKTAYLNIAVNPVTAHNDYEKNPDVVKMIACGGDIQGPAGPCKFPWLRLTEKRPM